MKSAAKLLVACLVLLVGLEATARLMIFGVRGLDPRRVGLIRDTHPEELVHFETEPGLVYTYRPELDVFFKLVRFRTNSHGMRDREYALPKPPGCLRVAVLGSSFALPAGVEIEDAFHSRLEAELPGCTEFLNFAVGMHLGSQFLAMLRERALRFDPDLAIVSVTAMSAPSMLGRWDRVPPRDVLRLVPRGPRAYLWELIRARAGSRPSPFPARAPAPARRTPPEEQVVTKLGELSRGHDLPMLLFRLELDATPPTPLERRLERRARAEGLSYLDTRAAFQGRDPRPYWIYELDPHPNGDAHAIFAAQLSEALAAEGLLPGVSESRTRTERSAASR